MEKKENKGIPKGSFCYGYSGVCCPHWHLRENKPEQLNGYCDLLKVGDWMDEGGELWNQVKLCSINEDWGDEEELGYVRV